MIECAAVTEWLTTTEAAGYLKIRPRTLAEWARKGMIRAYPLSGRRRVTWRFRKRDLDEHLTASLSAAVVHSSVSSAALQ